MPFTDALKALEVEAMVGMIPTASVELQTPMTGCVFVVVTAAFSSSAETSMVSVRAALTETEDHAL